MNEFQMRNLNRVLASDPVGYSLKNVAAAVRQSGGTIAAPFQKTGFSQPFQVTNVAQLLDPIRPERQFLYLENHDPLGNVTISFGRPNPFGIGMRAAAGGGGVLLDIRCPTAEIYIIGDIAANPNVSYIIY
jgi:hypothetical protein